MTTQMGIRLTDEQLSDLEEIAREQHNTRSGLIRLAIDQYREHFHREKNRQQQEPELPLDVVGEEEEALAVNFAQQPKKEGR